MALNRERGIVVLARDMGDNDRIVSLLGEEGPRNNYFIRGIRKSRTRPIAASEIGSYVEFVFYDREGKDWKDVKEIQLIQRYDSIKSSVIGLYFLSYICEIASLLMPEGEIHSQECKLLRLAFDEVEENGFHFGILPFLKVRLFGYLGIIPVEFHCSDCGHDIWNKDEADLQESSLELVCGDCRSLIQNRIGLIRFFRDCYRMRYRDLFSEVIPVGILLDLDRILNHYLDNYLGKSLKTEKEFYRMLADELQI